MYWGKLRKVQALGTGQSERSQKVIWVQGMTEFPTQKYAIIYADPPWSYRNKGTRAAADRHYSTMSIEDIKALPVADIAAEDCVLFLWATFPMLREALETIEAWGFEYKTAAFVWVKQNRLSPGWFWGLGNWTRSNAEVCLLAVKGRPQRVSAAVHSIIEAPVGKHSEKPKEVRKRIVELMGDVPRIELFARERVPGWDAWGDEV